MRDWDAIGKAFWKEYKIEEFLKKLDSKPEIRRKREKKKKPKGDKNG